jgi:hypothetical protein
MPLIYSQHWQVSAARTVFPGETSTDATPKDSDGVSSGTKLVHSAS